MKCRQSYFTFTNYCKNHYKDCNKIFYNQQVHRNTLIITHISVKGSFLLASQVYGEKGGLLGCSSQWPGCAPWETSNTKIHVQEIFR